ncbi:MAG: MAPEG family protein [Pseudomonadota bacterium]
MPIITSLFAGILGLMSMWLSAGAGGMRGKTGISIGDGGNTEMLLAMRKHQNFTEYVPLALILIGLLEMAGTNEIALYVMGSLLVLARLAHGLGLKADTMSGFGRFFGAACTALITVVASVWCIVNYARAL